MEATKTKSKVEPIKSEADFAERVGEFRHECELWLDRKAEELKAIYPSIPIGVHRQQLMAQSHFIGCACMSVIEAVDAAERNK